MSKHKLNPVTRRNEVAVVEYSFYFETDSGGDVTASSIRGQHWSSISKTATGNYTLTLNDTFRKLLKASVTVHGVNDTIGKPHTVTQNTDNTTFLIVTRASAANADVTSGIISGSFLCKATIVGEGI